MAIVYGSMITVCFMRPQEIHLLRRHMFPPLMCMAAAEGDNDTLEDLRKQVQWIKCTV